jgi:hypothetical protein
MDIITTIFNFVIAVAFLLLKIILAPIDLLISSLLPALDQTLTNIGSFLTIISSSLGWAISASGIPYSALALIGSYFIFKLTLPINVWLVKLSIKWYKAIKP